MIVNCMSVLAEVTLRQGSAHAQSPLQTHPPEPYPPPTALTCLLQTIGLHEDQSFALCALPTPSMILV